MPGEMYLGFHDVQEIWPVHCRNLLLHSQRQPCQVKLMQLAHMSSGHEHNEFVEGHDEGEEQSVLMGSNTTIY